MRNKKQPATAKQAASTFWDAIREIRLAKGMTQEELAEQVRDSADAPWISRVESGKKDISLRTAIRIAHALGVDMFVDRYKILGDD